MAKIGDVKIKLVVDDTQALEVMGELMRATAAFERMLDGMSKALTSDESLREECALLRTQRDDALALLGAACWQGELAARQARELPCEDPDKQLLRVTLGVSEEAGDLAHVVLNRSQGLRGSEAAHVEAARDALGDIAIYSMQLASLLGLDWLACVERKVRMALKRRWHGGGPAEADLERCHEIDQARGEPATNDVVV
jgi:NTP pyrophosphatase (non-canonical NTP hydrolase)